VLFSFSALQLVENVLSLPNRHAGLVAGYLRPPSSWAKSCKERARNRTTRININMGLCKCMNITDLFCFVHKKAVCQGCICPEHKTVRHVITTANRSTQEGVTNGAPCDLCLICDWCQSVPLIPTWHGSKIPSTNRPCATSARTPSLPTTFSV